MKLYKNSIIENESKKSQELEKINVFFNNIFRKSYNQRLMNYKIN